jgi:hypothetical protein
VPTNKMRVLLRRALGLLGLCATSVASAITVEPWAASSITVPEGDAQDTLGDFVGQTWISYQMPEVPLSGIRTHAVAGERVSRSTVFDGHSVTVFEGVPGSGSRVL